MRFYLILIAAAGILLWLLWTLRQRQLHKAYRAARAEHRRLRVLKWQSIREAFSRNPRLRLTDRTKDPDRER